jgi:hypothetical protein
MVDEGIERLEGIERDELGQPGVAQLAEVGQRVAGIRRQQLLVGSRPWQLLHPHLDLRKPRAKRGQQLGDDLGLATHRPEVHRAVRTVASAAAGDGQEGRARRERLQRLPSWFARGLVQAHGAGTVPQLALASQPPSNPARSRPRRSGTQLRMSSQTSALR